MVKSAKSEYAEIIERNRLAKFDGEFLNMWHSILNISKSAEILNICKDNEKFEKGIDLLKEELPVY